jgi:hypothetical protein
MKIVSLSVRFRRKSRSVASETATRVTVRFRTCDRDLQLTLTFTVFRRINVRSIDRSAESQNGLSEPILENQLIQAIAGPYRKRFVRDLQRVDLKVDDLVSAAGKNLAGVYFPVGAVISAVCTSEDAQMDVHGVGCEGMLGSDVLLGVERSRFELVCQISGTLLYMPTASFQLHMQRHAGLQRLVARYAFDVLALMAQSVACTGLHSIAQRCARWLLITGDRVAGAEFDLTQGLLARMLGVRRAGVSVAVSQLQAGGLIQYRLGRIRIVDREKLKEKSCTCYGIVMRERADSRGSSKLSKL